MDSKEFKKIFLEISKEYGFKSAFGGSYIESDTCIFVLELQKSNFGNYFELNMKIYIQGAFGNKYTPNKDIIKKYMGNIFTRPLPEYHYIWELYNDISDEERKTKLRTFFEEYINPIQEKALTISGIKALSTEDNDHFFITPAVKSEIKRLYGVDV